LLKIIATHKKRFCIARNGNFFQKWRDEQVLGGKKVIFSRTRRKMAIFPGNLRKNRDLLEEQEE
jgi:hypothetical protein